MKLTNEPMRKENPGAARQSSDWSVLLKSIVLSVIVVATLASGQYLWSVSPWPPHKNGDQVTANEADAREAAFIALEPIRLSLVSTADVTTAVDKMGLTPAEKTSLLSSLDTSVPNLAALPAATATPQPVPASVQPARGRLAWITLWDSDAEDGDAVRIDSQGYSQTIVLKKQPLTIAVPVPLDGVIKVTGVIDGEGGGITVGFASGASRAVFPIMSVGQVLGLKVRFD
jgi:hypothetical protein